MIPAADARKLRRTGPRSPPPWLTTPSNLIDKNRQTHGITFRMSPPIRAKARITANGKNAAASA